MGREKHSPPLNFKPRALPTQVPPTFTLEETWLQHLEGGKDFSLILLSRLILFYSRSQNLLGAYEGHHLA